MNRITRQQRRAECGDWRAGKSLWLSALYSLLSALLLTRPLPAQSMQETIETTLPRVVKIFGAGGLRGLEAYSTGFLVSPQGHVATIWSHVLDAGVVTVVLNNGRRYQADVLGAEPQLNLAVLKLQADDLTLPYFDLEQAGTVGPGTRILGFSNMFKVAVGDEPVSVMHGVIAARTKLSARRGAFEIPYDGPVYIVDAITNNSGAGGGVVVTDDGTLLGMIGQQLRNVETNTWINYAIPMTELRGAIDQMIRGEYGPPERTPPPDENPKRYRPTDFGFVMLPDVLFRTPAYVGSVLPGSPAETAGLRRDDLILFVNDELVQSIRQLNEQLGRLEAGDKLRLIVRRDDKLISVQMPAPVRPR